jgi:antitoxin Phd
MRGPKTSWQLQTAKARFSELFRRARSEGPQLITRQGKEGVVMISDEEYERLVGKAHQPKSFLQFFRESPLVGVELDLEQQKDEGRDLAHSRAADKSDPQYYARLTVTKAVAEIRTHSASIPNTSEAGNHRDRN